MKIAITGPNGFISQNIILHLGNKYDLILLSRKKLKSKNLKKKQIFKFDMSKNMIPKLSCDVLIHAAALTPINKNFKNYHQINFLSLKKIIRNIKIKKKIIFLSTSNIYRNQKKNFNLRENSKIDIRKLDQYAKSKYKSELFLKNLDKKKYYFKKLILRLPGIIGKDSHPNFINNLKEKIIKKKKFSLYGPTNPFNNVCHINHLVKIIEILIKKKINKNFEIFNVGAKNPLQISEILKLFNKGKRISFSSAKKEHVFTLNVDKLNKYYKNNPSTKFVLKKYFEE